MPNLRYFLLPSLVAFLLWQPAVGTAVAKTVSKKATHALQGQRYELSFGETKQKAIAGDPDAEYALGYMYYYGIGTVQDLETAQSWIQKAAAQNQPQAVSAMELLTAAEHAKQAQVLVKHAKGSLARIQKAAPKPKKRAPGTVTLTNAEKSLMAMPGKRFTLQLLATTSQAEMSRFIAQYDIGDSALVYMTYRKKDPRDWYVVVYGDYKSSLEAKLALLGLPKDIQNMKPWVKKLVLVQADIRKRYPSS